MLRAVLAALILGSASATNCPSYPCTCEGALTKPPPIRDDGVCVKVGKPWRPNCPDGECGGVRPNLDEARCAEVAAIPYYAAQCDGTPEEQCWTWCPLPTPTPTTSTTSTRAPPAYSYNYETLSPTSEPTPAAFSYNYDTMAPTREPTAATYSYNYETMAPTREPTAAPTRNIPP